MTVTAETTTELRINRSAVIYQENGVWIAHCIELDIVSEGKDADDAVESLISLCDFQIKTALAEGDLQGIFRPAPPETWRMFAVARSKMLAESGRFRQKSRFEAPVSRFEARQLAVA